MTRRSAAGTLLAVRGLVFLALSLAHGASAEALSAESRQYPTARAKTLELRDLILADKFADVQRAVDEMVRDKPMTRNGKRLLEEVYGQLPGFGVLDAPVARWAGQPRAGHAAFTLLGLQHIRRAWRARGSGWGADVEDQAHAHFRRELEFARLALEKASRLEPRDPYAASKRIVVAMATGEARPAMEGWFEAARKTDPRAVTAYESKMQYLMPKWSGSPEEAEAFAQECWTNAPPGSRVYTVALDWLEEQARSPGSQKNFWRAERDSLDRGLARWLGDFPNSTEARWLQIRVAEVLEDWALVTKAASEALAIDSSLVWAAEALGNVYYRQGDYAKSESNYKQAVTADPLHADAFYGLARVELYGRKRPEQALQYLQQAAALDSAKAPHAIDLGRVYALLGRRQEALDAFAKALTLNASYAATYLYRGMLLWPSDRDAALRDLGRASELDRAGHGSKVTRFKFEMTTLESECEGANAVSCTTLGRKYDAGVDVGKDPERARSYYAKACAAGDPQACKLK
jgi:tetratricopeptide (TPR) repeat protein